MPLRLVLKPLAEEQIDQAYCWYEDQRVNLGDEFLGELQDYFDTIQKSPSIFSKPDNNYHQAFLKRFPYVIVYDIYEKEVIVYTVYHTSRNPNNRLSDS